MILKRTSWRPRRRLISWRIRWSTPIRNWTKSPTETSSFLARPKMIKKSKPTTPRINRINRINPINLTALSQIWTRKTSLWIIKMNRAGVGRFSNTQKNLGARVKILARGHRLTNEVQNPTTGKPGGRRWWGSSPRIQWVTWRVVITLNWTKDSRIKSSKRMQHMELIESLRARAAHLNGVPLRQTPTYTERLQTLLMIT